MNITNSLPIIYSNPNVKSRSVESAESDNIRISRNSKNEKELEDKLNKFILLLVGNYVVS